MANKYCNIDGSKSVKDEYAKIATGFDSVEADVNAANTAIQTVDARVTNIITTPISGAAATQEVVDARNSGVKGVVYASVDARLEAIETDAATASNSTPTDYTATILPIPNTAFVGKLTLTIKGRTDVVIPLTADYTDKISGSTTLCANKAIQGGNPTLYVPASQNDSMGQTYLDALKTLNGVCAIRTTLTNLEMAQHMFSIDAITEIERKIGKIPGATLADKITYVKNNLSTIKWYWNGYGSGPSGNKATLQVWNATNSTWGGTVTHTNPTVTQLTNGANTSNLMNYIDVNGFIHILANADASNGTISSTINTDYVKIDFTFKALASVLPQRVKSIGRNTFNKDAIYTLKTVGATISSISNGVYIKGSTNSYDRVQWLLKLKPNTQYTISRLIQIIRDGTAAECGLLRIMNAAISTTYAQITKLESVSKTFTSPADGVVCLVLYGTGGTAETAEYNFTNIQLEEGSTATTYEQYKETITYTPPIELRAAGNTYDEFNINTGLLTTRVNQRILISGDVYGMHTAYTNLDYAKILLPADYVYNVNGGNVYLEEYGLMLPIMDDASRIGKVVGFDLANRAIAVGVAKGTTLAASQALLAGKKANYSIATLTSQYEPQVLDAYPSGTVYVEPIIKDTTRYATNIAVANTTYPIKLLVGVTKLTTNNLDELVRTSIDISTCTVAADGLSFTSTALALNDMVEYEYEWTNVLNLVPTINISYAQNLRAIVDGVVSQNAKLEVKVENLEHYLVWYALNNEARIVLLEARKCTTQASSTATDVTGLKTDFNALITKLKAAGLMA